jgi:CHASE2 domain-containing sensor protein
MNYYVELMSYFSRLRLSFFKTRYLWYFLLPLLIAGFRDNGVVRRWDSFALDRLISIRPAEPPDDHIVIVTIDEDDLQKESSISDQNLAKAINLIAAAQPRVIGVDLVRDGAIAPELQDAYQKHENVIGISKSSPPDLLLPPLGLPQSRAGFGDYVPDVDSLVRRAQLASFTPGKTPSYSFAFQLARLYLQQQGKKVQIMPQRLELNNRSISPLEVSDDLPVSDLSGSPLAGSKNPEVAESFDVLISYRQPYGAFKLVKLADVLAQKQLGLQGKVVILGYSASTKHDFVNTGVFPVSSHKITGNILGAEYHSYIVSQLLSTAIDDRSFIQPLPFWGDYLWILVCVVSSGLLLRVVKFKTPFWLLLTVVVGYTTGVCLSIYFLFLAGWLLPIGLTSGILVINLPLLVSLYQREQSLLAVAEKRRQAISETFNAIHNGPLQELSLLLQAVKSGHIALSEVSDRLEHLNLQIRHIGESLQQSASKESAEMLVLGDGEQLDLNMPLNELLHLVADRTLYNDRYPNLSDLKVKVINFQEIPGVLSMDQKRQLCQFLEEAIGNAGKYAVEATRMQLLGRVSGGVYRLSVEDNGRGEISDRVGAGTRQARRLAASLGGRFDRKMSIAKHQLPSQFATDDTTRTTSGVICFIEWNLNI